MTPWLSVAFAFFVTLFLPLSAGAQEDGPPRGDEGKTVTDIEVQYIGAATVDKDRLLATMKTKVGSPFSQETIQDDVRALASYGIANFITEPYANGVRVVVVVQTRAALSNVIIQGNSRFDSNRLRQEVELASGETIDEVKLQEGVFNIEELYAKKGYSDVTVSYEIRDDPRGGYQQVIYTVNEGEASRLRKVVFRGNTDVSSRQLRGVMKVRKASLWNMFTSRGRIDRGELEEDVLRIEQEFRNHGYLNAKVVTLEQPRVGNSDKVDLVITVEQGEKFWVEDVKVSGNNQIALTELAAAIRMAPGGVYSEETLLGDIERISDFYGARGYADARITPRIESAGPQRITVFYDLREGAISYVRKINISGNQKTRDVVLRRELAVQPGDIYNTVKMRVSKRRLEGIGFFTRPVEVLPDDTGEAGYKDININVTERETGSISFGAGFSSVDNLVGFLDISQSNFDLFNFPSMTGAGQKFRMGLKWGTRRKDFVLSLSEPWFLNRRLTLGGEVYYRDSTFLSDEYDERRYGGAIFLRKPVGEHSFLQAEYRLQKVKIHDIDFTRTALVDSDGDGIAEEFFDGDNDGFVEVDTDGDGVVERFRTPGASPEIFQEEGDYLESKLSLNFVSDTRDSFFTPRTGQRWELGASVSGGFLGGDVDSYNLKAGFVQHVSLPGDLIFSFEAAAEVADTWNSGDRVPIFNRHFLGGSYDMRGFEYRDVGPKDVYGEPIGGGTSATATLELTFPIFERVRGAVFYDVGFVNEDAYDFSTSDINSDYGFGVRLMLPISPYPLQLDYAFPIETDEFNDSGGRFNFVLGARF